MGSKTLASSRIRQNVLSTLALAGITEPPVNTDKVAEALGFKIMPHAFPLERKGMVHIEDNLKVIGVNSRYSAVVQRFTVAHELGHYLSGHEHIENTFVDDERRLYEPYFHTEKEADMFAAELLMPKNFLEADLKQFGLDIPILKDRYQVSEQALWIRLTSTGLAAKYGKN